MVYGYHTSTLNLLLSSLPFPGSGGSAAASQVRKRRRGPGSAGNGAAAASALSSSGGAVLAGRPRLRYKESGLLQAAPAAGLARHSWQVS